MTATDNSVITVYKTAHIPTSTGSTWLSGLNVWPLPRIQKHANREGYPRRKSYFGRKNGLSRGNFCSAAQEILEFFVLILVVSLVKFEYIEFESLSTFITKSLLGR